MSALLNRIQRDRKKRRKIVDLDVSEISLVDSPSNRRPFAIVKADGADPELLDEIRKFYGAEFEGLEDVLEKAAELPAEAAAAIKDALKTLNKFTDVMPDPVLDAMKTLAQYSDYGYPAKDEGDDGDGQDEGDDEHFEDKKKRIRKAAEAFPSLNRLIFKLPYSPFARALQKKSVVADGDDQAQDQDADADVDSALEKLKLTNQKLVEENARLSRRSAQAKEGVDDDEHFAVEKDSGIDPKTGRVTRDLWPSMDFL